MDFEWSRAKAKANEKKHGVAFEEAASIFGDPLALTFADPDNEALRGLLHVAERATKTTPTSSRRD